MSVCSPASSGGSATDRSSPLLRSLEFDRFAVVQGSVGSSEFRSMWRAALLHGICRARTVHRSCPCQRCSPRFRRSDGRRCGRWRNRRNARCTRHSRLPRLPLPGAAPPDRWIARGLHRPDRLPDRAARTAPVARRYSRTVLTDRCTNRRGVLPSSGDRYRSRTRRRIRGSRLDPSGGRARSCVVTRARIGSRPFGHAAASGARARPRSASASRPNEQRVGDRSSHPSQGGLRRTHRGCRARPRLPLCWEYPASTGHTRRLARCHPDRRPAPLACVPT
jgi:hypothetical protein